MIRREGAAGCPPVERPDRLLQPVQLSFGLKQPFLPALLCKVIEVLHDVIYVHEQEFDSLQLIL